MTHHTYVSALKHNCNVMKMLPPASGKKFWIRPCDALSCEHVCMSVSKSLRKDLMQSVPWLHKAACLKIKFKIQLQFSIMDTHVMMCYRRTNWQLSVVLVGRMQLVSYTPLTIINGPVHKGANHVPKAVSVRDPRADWVHDLNWWSDICSGDSCSCCDISGNKELERG